MATTMHEVSMYCMARTERRGYLGARGGSLKSQKTTWGVLCAVDTPACQVYPHSTITYSFTSIDFQPKWFEFCRHSKAIKEDTDSAGTKLPVRAFLCGIHPRPCKENVGQSSFGVFTTNFSI